MFLVEPFDFSKFNENEVKHDRRKFNGGFDHNIRSQTFVKLLEKYFCYGWVTKLFTYIYKCKPNKTWKIINFGKGVSVNDWREDWEPVNKSYPKNFAFIPIIPL